MTLPWEAHSIVWPAVILSVLILTYVLFGREVWVSYRIIGRFLLTIAFPLTVVIGGGLLAVSMVVNLPVPIWQALIAGASLATGWLTTSIFAELARRQSKEEKTRDYHKALYAEIRDALAALGGEGQSYADAMIARMRGNPEFIPFIPKESHDRVYSVLINQIEVLPRQTIDIIVTFYSLIQSLSALSEDMRGQMFKRMEQDRRILMYQDYFQMRTRAYFTGLNALKLIKAYSDKGPQFAEGLAALLEKSAISSPDAVPSDRSQGTE